MYRTYAASSSSQRRISLAVAMLTSPIKPPLPSPSPSPTRCFCSFFPPRMSPQPFYRPLCEIPPLGNQPPPSSLFLPRQPCGHSIVCRSANTPSCFSYLFIIKKFEKNRRCYRLPAATPAGTPYVTLLTFHEGGPVSPFFRVHPC